MGFIPERLMMMMMMMIHEVEAEAVAGLTPLISPPAHLNLVSTKASTLQGPGFRAHPT